MSDADVRHRAQIKVAAACAETCSKQQHVAGDEDGN